MEILSVKSMYKTTAEVFSLPELNIDYEEEGEKGKEEGWEKKER